MKANERKGARKDRNLKHSTRTPELGYYMIVTDTNETEKNYFEGLRATKSSKLPKAKKPGSFLALPGIIEFNY